MTDLDYLRRAILLDPADDLARLAYADECEALGLLGDAALVRYAPSLTLHRLPKDHRFNGHSWGSPDDGLLMWHNNALRVVAPLEPAPCEARLTIRRGFVEAVRCTFEDYLEWAPRLFSREPVRAVTISDWTETLLPGLHQPWLAYPAEGRMDSAWKEHWWEDLIGTRYQLAAGRIAWETANRVGRYLRHVLQPLSWPTHTAALAALSPALVNAGRYVADLPALKGLPLTPTRP